MDWGGGWWKNEMDRVHREKLAKMRQNIGDKGKRMHGQAKCIRTSCKIDKKVGKKR